MTDRGINFFRGSFLKLPILAAQLAGTFPLSISNVNDGRFVRLAISWKSIGLLTAIMRAICFFHVMTLFIEKADAISQVLGDWSSTLVFAEFLTHGIVVFGDFTVAVMLIFRRQRVNQFLTELGKTVTGLWNQSKGLRDHELSKTFVGQYRFMKWAFGWVIVMAITNTIGTYIICIPKVAVTYPDWVSGPVDIGIFLGYYELTMHFRLLSFFPVVAFIYVFYTSFGALRANVEHVTNQDVNWIIDCFGRLEKLLKEFHSLFGFQLIIGVLTILSSVLSVSFQGLILIMNFSKRGSNPEGSLIHMSIIPWATSLSLVFYILCDIATRMTTAAKGCVWAFREWPDVDELRDDDKQRLILFYIEGCTRPPKVSPGNLFTLGRHLFPSVLGIMTTYLIVLYQFESDDKQKS